MTNEKTLTVNEVLRFANHDFLNQLQLIKINLDLGRAEAAKESVEQIAEQCKTFFNINKLGLPKTIEWIHTLGWRCPNFNVTIQCMIEHEVDERLDEVIYNYLDQSVSHIYPSLDPFAEQQLSLQIYATEKQFEISFNANGHWNEKEVFNQTIEHPLVAIEDEQYSEQEWHYVIVSKKEGI
ncbi:Spo0B domain-containing protein [Rummeliibacillus pycnus]|uniref:Spo0B domain-containing protein n=1 Tax=Rummeliibacillus pycnus TaxID=101070 RepID=UPI000C9BDB6B|nr:Spo0B domain-containing protein [Rummeliibacillus pycnus]